jgi:RecB family exonuclease
MLAGVQYSGDVHSVVEQFRLGGIIDKTEAVKIEILMQAVVEHAELKPFFSAGVFVKNETELLDEDGKIHRPDRVVINGDELCVIDYKTGEKAESHKKQITDYANAFRKLGYENVQAKLVYLNEAVEVEEV